MTDSANSKSPQPEPLTPADFPRNLGGAVSGAQPKLLAVKVGDAYVQGTAGDRLHARYETCFDLVNQLEEYCLRKLVEHPDWTSAELLRKLRIGVARRVDWGCTVDEQQWILKKLCHRMSWPVLATEVDTGEFKSLCPEFTITDQRLIDKLMGHKYTADGMLAPPEIAPETLVEQVMKRLGSKPTTELKQQ